MTTLRDHPGFYGLTSRGVIAIHADWPAYPEDHGWQRALAWLALFPPETKLQKISDIDRCLLFVALPIKGSDPFDRHRNFHYAVWHEDLLDLHAHGFVSGVQPCTAKHWWTTYRAQLPSDLYYSSPEGPKKIDLEELGQAYDDDDDDSWIIMNRELTITEDGQRFAGVHLEETQSKWLRNKEQILLEQGFLDTAVREACVEIEHMLKASLKTKQYGQHLISTFEDAMRNRGVPPALATAIRSRLSGTFHYIRNQYMHNVVDLTRTSCISALWHMYVIRQDLEHVIQFCGKETL